MSEEKKGSKEKILEQVGNGLKALTSKRVYAGVSAFLANRMVLRLAEKLHPGVVVTTIICFTLLGIAFIASETIRKK